MCGLMKPGSNLELNKLTNRRYKHCFANVLPVHYTFAPLQTVTYDKVLDQKRSVFLLLCLFEKKKLF